MIEVFCHGCGQRGHIEKVGAEILHVCGSKDVDLWLGDEEQLQRIASLREEPEPVFAEFMRTGAQQAMPHPAEADDRYPGYVGTDPEPGWDEYVGPGPHPNPMNPPQHSGKHPGAPTRKTPGVVEESNAYVYDKHRPPEGYGENPPPPPVAHHDYPNHSTTTPFLGRRKQLSDESAISGPGLPLKGASCPRCDAPDTKLMPDYREHAHWYCQSKCGSLADLDRHLTIDPFDPPARHPWGSDTFKREKKIFAGKKNGQVLARIATITLVNPGLSPAEVVGLARQSVIQYPEA